MTILFINGKEYTVCNGEMFYGDSNELVSREDLILMVCSMKDIISEAQC